MHHPRLEVQLVVICIRTIDLHLYGVVFKPIPWIVLTDGKGHIVIASIALILSFWKKVSNAEVCTEPPIACLKGEKEPDAEDHQCRHGSHDKGGAKDTPKCHQLPEPSLLFKFTQFLIGNHGFLIFIHTPSPHCQDKRWKSIFPSISSKETSPFWS